VILEQTTYIEEMKFLTGEEEPCTSLNTIQVGEEGEQESEKRWTMVAILQQSV